jgi:hypothetical protein
VTGTIETQHIPYAWDNSFILMLKELCRSPLYVCAGLFLGQTCICKTLSGATVSPTIPAFGEHFVEMYNNNVTYLL